MAIKEWVKRKRPRQYDEGTVKALKKDKNVDNPWALATWIKRKGKKDAR